MELKSCIKIGYGKCETPENTVRRLESLLTGRYAYRMMEEKVSDNLFWAAMFIDGLSFRAMGKGVSAVLSKAGALAEGAEWLTAREFGQLPGYTIAHQSELSDALPIEELLSHVGTVTPSLLETIKNEEAAQYWVDAESLLNGRRYKVPIEFVRRISGPNGLAAGNRVEEALVHATDEIFERRAHITVLKQRLVMPTVDIDSIEHPVIRSHIDFIRDKGIEVFIKDLSFGGVLPCIGAYFLDPNIPEEYQFHHFFKVGASFNREDALMRTFTEYVQGRRLDEFIRGTLDEQERVLKYDFRGLKCMPDDGDNFLSAFMFGFVPTVNADFLKEGDLVPFDRGECFEDCLDDIERSREIFRQLGKDYLVVDFTHPDIGFPVVEAIVPGYSDVLPYHPASSPVLFKHWSRADVLASYGGGGE
jgi:ribosomal protein S12 methylthiotransferase accessory factor